MELLQFFMQMTASSTEADDNPQMTFFLDAACGLSCYGRYP